MSKEEYIPSKKILLTDPFNKSTLLIKRNLLFFSAVTIIGITYGPDTIKLPMTNLPSNTLLGALGCIVIYHIISYIISFTTDVQGWHISYRNVLHKEQLESLEHLSERMATVDLEFNRLHSHLSSNKRVYKEQSDKINNTIIEYLESNKENSNTKAIIEEIQASLFGSMFLDGAPEVFKTLAGDYQRDVDNMSEILTYLYNDAKRYRKLEKLIKRELLQLRIAQYFQVYAWSLVIPLAVAFFSIKQSLNLIILFIETIL